MPNIRFVFTLCSRSSSDAVDVKGKINTLCSRVVALEKLFEKPACDGREKKRREGLLMYASGLRSGWTLKVS